MTLSPTLLTAIVYVALLVTIIAPVALIVFWYQDWRKGKLW